MWDQIYELEHQDEKEIAEYRKTGQEVIRQTVSIETSTACRKEIKL